MPAPGLDPDPPELRPGPNLDTDGQMLKDGQMWTQTDRCGHRYRWMCTKIQMWT